MQNAEAGAGLASRARRQLSALHVAVLVMDVVIIESVLGGLVEEVVVSDRLLDVVLLDVIEEVVAEDELPEMDDGWLDVNCLIDTDEVASVVE